MRFKQSIFSSFVFALLAAVSAFPSLVLAQSAGTFTAAGNMTTPRSGHTATLLADGRVLIAGGFTHGDIFERGDSITATAELYEPVTGTFTATGNMTSPRGHHTATLLADGKVLITGSGLGQGPTNASEAGAELYEPSTGTFTRTANMTTPRSYHAATLVADGRVLIVGGCTVGICNYAEIYDPRTGTFDVTGNGAKPWNFTTPILLPDGKVLFAGPEISSLYDPDTGTFSITLTGDGLFADQASLLMNGKVLVAGGNNDPGPSTGAVLYDSSTGEFSPTGNMTAPRSNAPLTLLPDGKTLIAGGRSWVDFGNGGMLHFCCVATSELYDPSTGTFTATGNMITARNYHTATLLSDGQVLIAGGSGGSNPIGVLATAELYHPPAPRAAPALFSISGDGRGQGAVWHADTDQIASPGTPAMAGNILSMFTTSLADGSVIPPQVAIGGRPAEILFFGNAPGFPGYYQVNFRVPAGVAPGSSVPVRLTYIGRPSNAVTIGVQ